MALTATIHTFEVQLSDMDRGVYETLRFKAARHPSETEEYLLTRALAYCLEYTDGIGFSSGLAEPDEPALSVRDLTGTIRVWIDIGAPDAARLHRASKAAPRVAVYTHRDPRTLLRALAGERIHRREALEIHAVDQPMLAALAERLDRRMTFALSVTDRQLFLSIGNDVIEGAVTQVALD